MFEQVFVDGTVAVAHREANGWSENAARLPACLLESLVNRELVGKEGDTLADIVRQNNCPSCKVVIEHISVEEGMCEHCNRPKGEHIKDMGALTKLIFGGDGKVVNKEGTAMVPVLPATLEVGMTEADFRNKDLGVGGAIIISAWLIHKDMGAMTSLNLASNMIGSEGAKHVAEALKVSVLLRLFWYQFHAYLTNGSTAVVCHYPQNMRALLSLNLSGNGLVPMVLPVGWTKGYDDSYDNEFTHTDGRKQGTDPSQPDFTGVIALSDVIPDMRALTKLTFGDKQVVTMTTEMTVADFSGKLESYEARIVASFLPKCT
jgi:hypothetical protein